MFLRFYKKLLFLPFFLAFILVPSSLVFGQSGNATRIGFFNTSTISPGTLVEVPIEIMDVEGLYALDITIHFDPAILTTRDADSSTQGIQMGLGKFLDPGLVLFNILDNVTGTGHFVMTQFNPSQPKSGDGILLVIYFEGLKTGESRLSLTDVQLSTRDGNPITAVTVESIIRVDVNAPPLVSTAIPVYQATQMILVPTLETTPTPTATPVSTAQVAVVNETQQPLDNGENQGATGDSLASFLNGNWWLVLILLVFVVAAGVFLLVIRGKPRH